MVSIPFHSVEPKNAFVLLCVLWYLFFGIFLSFKCSFFSICFGGLICFFFVCVNREKHKKKKANWNTRGILHEVFCAIFCFRDKIAEQILFIYHWIFFFLYFCLFNVHISGTWTLKTYSYWSLFALLFNFQFFFYFNLSFFIFILI